MGIFSWLSRDKSVEEPGWLRRWVIPSRGRDDPELDDIQEAAAADVADLEAEDRKYFRRHGPGQVEDDL
jgi:hypothetical protein